jgi:hypothetical protein
MYKIAIALMCLLLWTHNVSAKEWSEREKQIYTFYASVVILDGLQSYSAMRDPCECFREANPVFGNTISNGELALATAFSLWGMHKMIEKDAPEWMLWAVAGGRAAVVVNNHMVGARIELKF